MAARAVLRLLWGAQGNDVEMWGRPAVRHAHALPRARVLAFPEVCLELCPPRLSLHGCLDLTALPEPIGEMKALPLLILSGCKSLTALPESRGGWEAKG